MSLSIIDHEGNNLAELKQTSFHGLPGIGCFTLVTSLGFHVTMHQRDGTLEHSQLRFEWGDNTQSILGIGNLDQPQPIMGVHYFSVSVSLRLVTENSFRARPNTALSSFGSGQDSINFRQSATHSLYRPLRK